MNFGKVMKKYGSAYMLLLPAILALFVFNICTLPGLLMAFMDYDIFKGFKSDWVGFANIKALFEMPEFMSVVWNTLKISLLNLFISFPMPLIFALLLNEVKVSWFKRVIQTVSYMPYFLSWIAIIGIASAIYSQYGLINDIRLMIMGENTERVLFMGMQKMFVPNIIILNIWKNLGWNTIIYLAALSGIDPNLYEAAAIDGAGKFRQCIHVTIPGVMTTFCILLIMQIGTLFADNFELVYGLQNPFIDYEVISTYIYKKGIQQGQYSMSTALGLVQGLVGFALMVTSNKISKKTSGYSMW